MGKQQLSPEERRRKVVARVQEILLDQGFTTWARSGQLNQTGGLEMAVARIGTMGDVDSRTKSALNRSLCRALEAGARP